VLKVSAEGLKGLEVGSKPRATGMCAMFGYEWCMNVEEVRKCGIVAGQEIVKRRGRVKNQLRITDIFDECLAVNGSKETVGMSGRRGPRKRLNFKVSHD